jgi:hypothetical protein
LQRCLTSGQWYAAGMGRWRVPNLGVDISQNSGVPWPRMCISSTGSAMHDGLGACRLEDEIIVGYSQLIFRIQVLARTLSPSQRKRWDIEPSYMPNNHEHAQSRHQTTQHAKSSLFINTIPYWPTLVSWQPKTSKHALVHFFHSFACSTPPYLR